MSKNILQYWPNPAWEPRPGQRWVLEQAAASEWDVLCITAPTAAGKTALGNTLIRWLGKGAYLTPTNMLVSQFREAYPRWASLQRKPLYTCENYQTNCSKTYSKKRAHCKGCPYVRDLRRLRGYPYKILTYHMYMAHKLKDANVLFDEGHNVIPVIRDLEARKIWRHDVSYPSDLRTIGDVRAWLRSCRGFDAGFPHDPKLALLRAELENAGERRFLVEKAVEPWRNDERDLLKLLPLDVSKAKPHLWAGAKKIILMSATIGPKDIEAVGLDRRRVKYLEIPSPIPPANRPCYVKSLGSFSYSAGGKNLPKLAQEIRERMDKYPHDKGLVHITYGMIDQLKKHLKEDPRLIWHNGQNKAAKFGAWSAAEKSSGQVLMAAGMHEGLDLLQDKGRWQIIAKVPWPSLGDQAIRFKAEQDPDWYEWEALKLVVQAYGRICRSPDDYGETVITDSSFFRISEKLYPTFFREALVR